MAEVGLPMLDRLAFLLQELDAAVDPEAKFTLRHEIDELRRSFAKVDGDPQPSYPDDTVRELAKALGYAFRRQEDLRAAGRNATAVREKILNLQREMRRGGRFKPGDFLLDGRFRLIEMIGKGGCGTVWKAYDRMLRGLAAIKVLHGQFAGDQTRRERFFRGARQMSRLQHQGVVQIVESACEDDGFHFFVMEYVDGPDLRQAVLDRPGALEDRMQIVLDMGETLSFAHDQGVIHRDVKPSNILLDADGHAKLSDFDLVRSTDTTGGTRPGGLLGTVIYAAPEIMHNPYEAGVSVDIYGLGMTAVFAIHGKELPLEAFRDASGFIAGLNTPLPIKAAISRAVSWKSEDRHGSMAEFCSELHTGLELARQEPHEPARAF